MADDLRALHRDDCDILAPSLIVLKSGHIQRRFPVEANLGTGLYLNHPAIVDRYTN
jgi:hypothetical protein